MKNSVIDMNVIQGLRRLQKPGRPDLLKDLLNLFFQTAEEKMLALREAVTLKDLKSIARAAHSLKSSAANLGAIEFSQTCLELEKLGNGEIQVDRLTEIFKKTESDYIKALDSLERI